MPDIKIHDSSIVDVCSVVVSYFGVIPLIKIFDRDLSSLHRWIGLLGCAVFSTTIAISIRFHLIRREGPIFLAPNAHLAVLLVNVFGFAILGEVITTHRELRN